MSTAPVVNAWSQFGDLEEIVVGRADNASFISTEPGFHAEINDDFIASRIPWPRGPVHPQDIKNCNIALENMVQLLEGEGITVRRPEAMDWTKPIRTPEWEVPNQYCNVCPRDNIITIGNVLMEATMSKRARFFEYQSYRPLIQEYWKRDPAMKWKVAPKPSMNDSFYNEDFWHMTKEERYERMHHYNFCINETEPAFDAADITRVGEDIFVQHSMTTNKLGIEWLKRELDGLVRVHTVHFPYDLSPSHIDCTFVPLRPGLVLTNPERPIAKGEDALWKENDWKFVDAPQPNSPKQPAFCQSSKWLSMNLLSISKNKVIIEEQEKPLYNFLEDLGFDVLTIAYRDVFEFGGSIHCSSWDIRRGDKRENFFPSLPSLNGVVSGTNH